MKWHSWRKPALSCMRLVLSRVLLLFATAFFLTAPVKATTNLSVATDQWPPFRILTANEQFTGFDIELLAGLSKHTGIDFTVQRFPWARALKRMEYGQVNMMSGLAFTHQRSQYIDYVKPAYFYCNPAFYVPKHVDYDIETYQDLYHHNVGYVIDSAYFEPFDSDEQIFKKGLATERQLIHMLAKGRIAVMVGTDCQVDYEISDLNLWHKIRKAQFVPSSHVALYLGISKYYATDELKQTLREGLLTMFRNGEISALKLKYFGISQH